ncbi:MAG TPA: hypothetical protein VHC86_10210 [Opitutaceae bacterium]|nr:hypothetical protein [Opitutaceae bacterium]
MKLRLQIHIAAFGLFTILGLIGSLVARYLEREAVRQAFADTSRTAAIAVAEFVEPGDIAAARAHPALDNTRLGLAWGRLRRWAIVRRFFLLDPATGRRIADTSPTSPVPAPADLAGLGADEVRILALRHSSDGHEIQTLLTPAAGGAAVVGVEVFADDYLAKLGAIRRDGIIDAVAASAFGLLMGALIGLLVSRPIRRIDRALEKIGQPEFASIRTTSPVGEIADLGNTLGIMHQVLGETVTKGRLSLLESDYYRSEAGFAEVYRRELDPPGLRRGAGAELVWMPVGAPSPAAIAGLLDLGGGRGAAYAGLAGAGSELVSTVRARAATTFLADRLRSRPLAAAAEETQALFGLSELAAARWDGEAIEFWRSRPGPAAAGAPSAWKSGSPVDLGCVGPSNRDRVAVYLATFADRVGAQTPEELAPLLDPAEPGVVALLRRRA